MSERPERPDTEWRPAPPDLRVGPNQVHVWRAGLQVDAAELERLQTFISGAERERTDRFQFPDLRRRYVAAHGVLRELLGKYLNTAPSQLRFEKNRHDKPFLATDCSAELRFNLSHAGELALLAFAHAREVGVDVEQIRAMPSGDRIAERYFTAAESARLRSVPPERRDEAFFDCWVRKEAFVKAVGQGVSFGLNRFELPVTADDRSSVPVPFTCPPDPAEWSLAPLHPDRGYTGAVVAAGTDWTLFLWNW